MNKLVVIVLVFLSMQLYSQDAHFSQSVASLPQKNAAFFAEEESDLNLLTVYREQWGAIGVPFKSAGLLLNALVYSPFSALKVNAGFLYLNDQSGDAKLTVNQLQLNLGASYKLGLNTFGFGLVNALTSKEFNPAKLTFPAQYDRSLGGFNEALASRENFNNQKHSFHRINLGFSWKRILTELWTVKTGFSLENLSRSGASFYDQEQKGDIAWNGQMMASYQLQASLMLTPLLAYSRLSKASETILGSGLRFSTAGFGNVKSIEPFLYSRWGIQRNVDALIVGSYLEISDFTLGASYDFNVSDLELASNYQGAFELSLSYNMRRNISQKRAIPCERY